MRNHSTPALFSHRYNSLSNSSLNQYQFLCLQIKKIDHCGHNPIISKLNLRYNNICNSDKKVIIYRALFYKMFYRFSSLLMTHHNICVILIKHLKNILSELPLYGHHSSIECIPRIITYFERNHSEPSVKFIQLDCTAVYPAFCLYWLFTNGIVGPNRVLLLNGGDKEMNAKWVKWGSTLISKNISGF